MTPIADIPGGANRVQVFLEALVSYLKANTGAAFIGSPGVAGLVGTTVQALLQALKTYIDTHKTSTDHDGRYYTEAELNAGQLDNRYFTETEVNAIVTALNSALSTHQLSADHDGRYYTEIELDAGQLDNRYYTETEIKQFISVLNGAIASICGITNAGGEITLQGGTGIQITTNLADHIIQITATGEAIPGAHGYTHGAEGTDPITPEMIGAVSSLEFSLVDRIVYLSSTIFVTTNIGNDYSISFEAGAVAALADLVGIPLKVQFNADSTAASTLNPGNLGAQGLKKADGSDVTNFKNGGIYTLVWSGVNFILQGEGGEIGTAGPAQTLQGYTVPTAAGLADGQIPTKAAQAYTPGQAVQTILAGQFLGGDQTISAVTVDATKVLSGTTIAGKQGTVPIRAGDTAALAFSISGTTIKLRASQGYRDGVDDNVTYNEPNWTEANIAYNKNVLGKIGTFKGINNDIPIAAIIAIVTTDGRRITNIDDDYIYTGNMQGTTGASARKYNHAGTLISNYPTSTSAYYFIGSYSAHGYVVANINTGTSAEVYNAAGTLLRTLSVTDAKYPALTSAYIIFAGSTNDFSIYSATGTFIGTYNVTLAGTPEKAFYITRNDTLVPEIGTLVAGTTDFPFFYFKGTACTEVGLVSDENYGKYIKPFIEYL
jgi:hypothetical protein